MSKKKIAGIVFAVLLLMVIASFTPSFMNQMNKQKLLDQRAADLGEGQTFNDGTTRCLLKDSDGFKCRPGTGYNMDTGTIDRTESDRLDIIGIARNSNPQSEQQVPQESWLSNHQGHLEQFIINNECEKIKEFYIAIEDHVQKSNEHESKIKMYNQGIKEYKEAYQEFCVK